MNLINTSNRSRSIALMAKINLDDIQVVKLQEFIDMVNGFNEYYNYERIRQSMMDSYIYTYLEERPPHQNKYSATVELLKLNHRLKNQRGKHISIKERYQNQKSMDNSDVIKYRYIRLPESSKTHINNGVCKGTVIGDINIKTELDFYGIPQNTNIMVDFIDLGIYIDKYGEYCPFAIFHVFYSNEYRASRSDTINTIIYPTYTGTMASNFYSYKIHRPQLNHSLYRTIPEQILESIRDYRLAYNRYFDRNREIDVSGADIDFYTKRISRRKSTMDLFDLMLTYINIRFSIAMYLHIDYSDIVKSRKIFVSQNGCIANDTIYLLLGCTREQYLTWVLITKTIKDLRVKRGDHRDYIELNETSIEALSLDELEAVYNCSLISDDVYNRRKLRLLSIKR